MNVGKTTTRDLSKLVEGYKATEDLATGFFGGRSVTDEVKAENKRVAQSLKEQVMGRVGLKKQAIITLLIPKEEAMKFLSGEPIEKRYVESLIDNLGKLLDLYDRSVTMDAVKKADVHFFFAEELKQLEDLFDATDYDDEITKLKDKRDKYLSGTGKELQEQGIDDSQTRQQFDSAIAKLQSARDSQNTRNSALILNFLNDRGYTMDILLPSFIDAVSAQNLEGKDFEEISDLIQEETRKTCIMHLVMKNDKPFEYVRLEKLNTKDDVLNAIVNKAGIPLEMLSDESLQSIEDEDFSNIQSGLDELVDMSRNLHLLKAKDNFPHFDLKKDYVHIPKGFLSGSEYKTLGTFDAAKLAEDLSSTDFGSMASYDKKAKTLVFYTPEKSGVFKLEGTYKLAVPGNVEMIKELQRCLTIYHLMSKCLHHAEGVKAGPKLPPPPTLTKGGAVSSGVNLPPPPSFVEGTGQLSPPPPPVSTSSVSVVPQGQIGISSLPAPLAPVVKRPLPPPPISKQDVLRSSDESGVENPLLASIRKGTKLKAVNQSSEKKEDLQGQIRAGVALRKVDTSQNPSGKKEEEPSLLGDIRKGKTLRSVQKKQEPSGEDAERAKLEKKAAEGDLSASLALQMLKRRGATAPVATISAADDSSGDDSDWDN